MSKQQFSNTFREALWETHGRKCFHCGRQILFSEMQIDHLISESLASDPDALQRRRRDLGLAESFNPLGHENLVPSCAGCNTKKGDLPLSDGLLGIHLASVKSKANRLRAQIGKRRREQDLDLILRAIARSVDAGKFSIDDLIRRLRTLQLHTDSKVPITFVWTPHALSAAQARGIAIHSVLNALANQDTAEIRAGYEDNQYWLTTRYSDGSLGIRVGYSVEPHRIIVRTVFWR